MARYSHTGIVVVIAGFGLLAGCGEESTLGPIASRADTQPEVSGAEAAGTSVEKDVEVPDVFSASENGLWDGRPSLGGVWVAHPDVRDPERVIIRNGANGNYVIGALFRRERENPGPRIQVSSDAAAELGMLAGQPAELEVVALRREVVQTPAPDPLVPPLEIAEVPADQTQGAADAEVAEVAALEPEVQAEAPKKRKGFLGGLFARKPRPEAPALSPTAPLTSAEIETASLDPVATAGAALDAADAATATVASAAPATAPPTETTLQQPFIQIGIFSVSDNAEDTAASLRQAGLVPTVREQEARGKQFWRVIVGPATDAKERNTLMAKVRDLGFEDSYYVSN